ncbi:hypothetical protein [Metabacillus sp. 84]|uniref:hypothetical protein n=1 Tax=unclassified Metabacillus TaxID=2675274 RepID=UPI003CEC6760
MFDPTVFDNLKFLLEGAVYDLDLDGMVEVTSRKDLVNLADMSRSWSITFAEAGMQSEAIAVIHLSIHLDQLEAELLRQSPSAGCSLELRFIQNVQEEKNPLKETEKFRQLWEEDFQISMRIAYDPLSGIREYKQTATLRFGRLLTEEHAGDLTRFVETVLRTIQVINDERGR